MYFSKKNYCEKFTSNEPEAPMILSLDYLIDMTVNTLILLYPELNGKMQNTILTSASEHVLQIISVSRHLQKLLQEYPIALREEENELFSRSNYTDIPF